MKHIVYRLIAFILLIALFPLFVLLYVLVKSTSKGPFLFRQRRLGYQKKPFVILKIRTMYSGADRDQKKYFKNNQADGPVFKIKDDPRFTKIGKWLARAGLDELPQLINIVRGEMSFVGPRPLPPTEANRIHKKYQKRFGTLPGITSLWVIKGAHSLSFNQWMKLDIEYVKYQSVFLDFTTLVKTATLLISSFLKPAIRTPIHILKKIR